MPAFAPVLRVWLESELWPAPGLVCLGIDVVPLSPRVDAVAAVSLWDDVGVKDMWSAVARLYAYSVSKADKSFALQNIMKPSASIAAEPSTVLLPV